MSGMGGSVGRGQKIVVATVVTVGIVAGFFFMKQAGLISQIGPVPTRLLVAGDVFVVGLMWLRAIRG